MPQRDRDFLGPAESPATTDDGPRRWALQARALGLCGNDWLGPAGEFEPPPRTAWARAEVMLNVECLRLLRGRLARGRTQEVADALRIDVTRLNKWLMGVDRLRHSDLLLLLDHFDLHLTPVSGRL